MHLATVDRMISFKKEQRKCMASKGFEPATSWLQAQYSTTKSV